ncbi:MAG: transposase [bacterium]
MARQLLSGVEGDEWGALAARLPVGWEVAAQTTGALERRRVFRTPRELFQAICCIVVGQCPLVEAAAWIAASGGPDVSAVALHKRLKRCGAWFAWMLAQYGVRARAPLPSWGRRVLVADATVITQPGSRGTDYRIHGLLNLGDLRWAGCVVTDAHGGEHLRRWASEPGDLILADRGYATPSNIAVAVAQGADVLIRWKRAQSGLRRRDGTRLDLGALVAAARPATQVIDQPSALRQTAGPLLPGRLIAFRGEREDWVFLWTTLPRAIRAARLIQLYRARWQVELVFKRFKSLGEVDDLPNTLPATAHAWLTAACTIQVLLDDWIADEAVALPPPARCRAA